MGAIKKRFRKEVFGLWAILISPILIILLIFILISKGVLGPMPTFDELENPDNNLAAEVYSDDGVLLGKFYIQNRTWTPYSEISPELVNALIATEDIRFYRHSGIDIRSLGRVFVRTLLMGQKTGGGSTITQQLAKNLFPREDLSQYNFFSRTARLVIAKFKEWQTAVKLERSYTKDEILTMYLNIFDFTYNAVGVRSAAQVYFNTTPDSLTLEESATLVGMLKNSALYNPIRRYDLTLARRNVVLSQMVKYGYLDKAVADSVSLLPIVIDYHDQGHNTGLATYFREYIRTTMIRPEPERRMFFTDTQFNDALWEWQTNPLYGWCRKNHKPDGSNYNLYRDGIKIYTTIDSRMQKYAEEAMVEHLSTDIQPAFYKSAKRLRNPPYSNDVNSREIKDIMQTSIERTDRYRGMKRSGMPEDSIMLAFNTPQQMRVFSWRGEIDTIMTPLDSLKYYKYFIRSSFMAMDPHSGYVKAYVGGPDFRYFKYDGVTMQKRQVGSTIKPFLYTLAIQDGYSPCYEVENIPRTFEVGDTTWQPRSSGPKEFHGQMVTLRWGLAQSENYISAWLMKQFSPIAVADLMHRLGIRGFIDPVPSIFLGTSDISLEEMVGAYGTYANKGVYTRPIYVSRIEDRNGNVISRFNPSIEEVISEEHAYLMLDLLQGVVREGSGIRMRTKYELKNQIGGKTGTTQNHSNGWFMGVTPNLVAGAWGGWEDQAIHFEDLTQGQGANISLPVVALFLRKVYTDPELGIMEMDRFEAPPGFNMELDCNKLKKTSPARINYYY